MNRVISGLQTLRLGRVLTALFVGLTLIASTILGQFGGAMPVQAAPIATESRVHPVGQTESTPRGYIESSPEKAEEAEEGLMGTLKDAADTVREKLNLDEPLPESTKAFFKQVQGEEGLLEEPRPSGK